MSIFKKIFLVAFSLICISFSMCYAIDENQLTQNSSNAVVATPNQSNIDNTNFTNAVDNTNAVDSFTQTVTSAAEPTTDNTSVSSTREQASTKPILQCKMSLQQLMQIIIQKTHLLQ